jgi:L-alanine-DL-glutamate epimerase-like enolase superfamily enzyme
LGGIYRNRIKPYGSLLFDEPDRLAEKLRHAVGRGFKAIKLGWKPFGRRDAKTDERLVQIARETVGPGVELMVDAGGSDAFWPHGWNTAIGLAADLHLTAALPVARYVEFLTPSPYVDELITTPLRPDAEGMLHVPTEKPGLGIELNREALRRYCI